MGIASVMCLYLMRMRSKVNAMLLRCQPKYGSFSITPNCRPGDARGRLGGRGAEAIKGRNCSGVEWMVEGVRIAVEQESRVANTWGWRGAWMGEHGRTGVWCMEGSLQRAVGRHYKNFRGRTVRQTQTTDRSIGEQSVTVEMH